MRSTPTTDVEPRTPELRWRVQIRIPLAGCNPLVPYRPGMLPPSHPGRPFHAAPIQPHESARFDQSWPRHLCPACGGRMGLRRGEEPGEWADAPAGAWDALAVCLWCDGADPKNEGKLRNQRAADQAIEAAQDSARRHEATVRKRLDDQHKKQKRKLPEFLRRELWLGPGVDIHMEPDAAAHTPAAGDLQVARDWLVSLGQLPDWTLILDRRGRVAGHYVRSESTGRWVAEMDGES